MATNPRHPRRFAPLDPNAEYSDAPVLRGIIFDVDALHIPRTTDILDHIYSLPSSDQPAAMESIREVERAAMVKQTPQRGLADLMDYLEMRGVRKGICTRNFDTPVNHFLEKFLKGKVFGPIITREFRPPKPDPAGILHIAESWNLYDRGESLIMVSRAIIALPKVGDSVDDMTAGHRAGAATVLLVNGVNAHLTTHQHTNLCISSLDELIAILERGFTGQIDQGDEHPDTKAQAQAALANGSL
ncbi:hypothetical protein FGG08_003513 [Glutinoglossum americanum]|uniref:Uncharacterized protein n=1 Tax=Glutinoglossum americanum TaxID=1670608 RepID=A0A9P8L4P2_9PEZI|nr:hypothetical protein FGG08_003513 [Glutinoglossum americanum]